MRQEKKEYIASSEGPLNKGIEKIKRHIEKLLRGEKLVFMHIPKCGGSSLHELLLQNYKPKEVFPERHNQFEKWSIRKVNRYRYYSGHFSYNSIVDNISGRLKIVTILREPKSRILSTYYFGRSHTWDFINSHPQYSNKPDCYTYHGMSYRPAKSLSLKEYLIQERPFLEDLMTRWLTSNQCEYQSRFSAAQNIIDQLYAVGILEEYDSFVAHLLKKLRLPTPKEFPRLMAFDNLTDLDHCEPVEKDPMTDEIDSLLDELTVLDRPLYEYARSRFQQDVK